MKIIANPRAGHGKGERNVEELRRVIRRRGLDFTPVLTERPGHATELARRAAEAAEPRLAVMGGDGTIGEVVDAIVGSDTELAILSTGTGNDVARSLGLPLNDLEAALDVALSGSVRLMDVGRERDRHFISVLGVGFPAVVAAEANRITWLKGSPAFFVAVYKALHRLRAVPLVVELDDRTLERECVAVLVQNTPFTGGGLHMAPGAEVDDGVLDVVVVDDISRLELMIHFPKAYRGRHFEHPSFSLHRSRAVSISSPTPLPKMFDGDLVGVTPVEATVVPAGVRMIVPARYTKELPSEAAQNGRATRFAGAPGARGEPARLSGAGTREAGRHEVGRYAAAVLDYPRKWVEAQRRDRPFSAASRR